MTVESLIAEGLASSPTNQLKLLITPNKEKSPEPKASAQYGIIWSKKEVS